MGIAPPPSNRSPPPNPFDGDVYDNVQSPFDEEFEDFRQPSVYRTRHWADDIDKDMEDPDDIPLDTFEEGSDEETLHIPSSGKDIETGKSYSRKYSKSSGMPVRQTSPGYWCCGSQNTKGRKTSKRGKKYQGHDKYRERRCCCGCPTKYCVLFAFLMLIVTAIVVYMFVPVPPNISPIGLETMKETSKFDSEKGLSVSAMVTTTIDNRNFYPIYLKNVDVKIHLEGDPKQTIIAVGNSGEFTLAARDKTDLPGTKMHFHLPLDTQLEALGALVTSCQRENTLDTLDTLDTLEVMTHLHADIKYLSWFKVNPSVSVASKIPCPFSKDHIEEMEKHVKDRETKETEEKAKMEEDLKKNQKSISKTNAEDKAEDKEEKSKNVAPIEVDGEVVSRNEMKS